jgi:two-component system, cell cycle sensor histidine kinase and response regulator CckA
MPQRWKDVHQRVLNGAIEQAEQDGFQRPDGSFTWNRWECRPWYHADGSIAGMITYTEVITERVEAERNLRQSEERYRRLVENSPNILYIFAPDRGGVYWSQRVEEILGWTPEQLAENPRAWHDAIHPEDRPTVDEAIEAATERSQPFSLEYRIYDAGGRLHWFHDRFIGVRIEGDDRLIEGLASDITQRKVAEQSLRESRQLLADAERLAAVGAWEWDAQADRWTLSENLRNILGAVSLSMDTEKLVSFVPEEDRPRIQAALDRALASGGKYEVEHQVIREDTGEIRTIRAIGEVETDPTGQHLRMIGASQDVTERLRLEQRRRELEQQIEAARRQESLTRMAGAIAHNFNNTLMGVMGNLSLVLENSPEDDNHELLADAQASAIKAAELSRLMLLYVGQGHKSHRPFSLTQLLRDNRENLRQLVPDEVELSIDLPETDQLEIRGDRTRIYEAICALVVNAGEAADKPQTRIQLLLQRRRLTRDELTRSSVAEKPLPGDYLTITVSDTGEGMDKDVIERMFDPYFSTKFTGRGLGLAIAMGVIRRHHGAVFVESTPGEGSRIELLLPGRPQEAPGDLGETSPNPRA